MLDVYRQYWRINLLTSLEYRANFWLWFAFAFVYHGSAIAALYVMLHSFPSMNGWDFRDMAFLYALWMTASGLAKTFAANIGDIPTYIRDGEFDRYLLRPLDTLFAVLVQPGAIFPDELLLALITLTAATAARGLHVDLAFVGLIAAVAIGGALIYAAIELIISTAAFWFVQVDALRWIVLQLEQEFTRYPLTIYSRGVRLFLSVIVPFAFINFLPATYVLGKSDTGLGVSPLVGLATPLVGIAAALIAYAFWCAGLNRYHGAGH